MRHFANRDQRRTVARRNRQPIQLEAVYTLAVPSRHNTVCHVVLVTTDLYQRRNRHHAERDGVAVASA